MGDIIKREGLYYWLDDDPRRHTDVKEARKLYQSIPDVTNDKCPVCGATERLDCCRCPDNHRYCKCGAQWRYAVNFRQAKVECIIERAPNPLTK